MCEYQSNIFNFNSDAINLTISGQNIFESYRTFKTVITSVAMQFDW